MNCIPADVNGKVSADGPRSRIGRIGGADDLATGHHHVLALPHHGNDGSRDYVLHEPVEEGLRRKIRIVLLREGALHTDKLQA